MFVLGRLFAFPCDLTSCQAVDELNGRSKTKFGIGKGIMKESKRDAKKAKVFGDDSQR